MPATAVDLIWNSNYIPSTFDNGATVTAQDFVSVYLGQDAPPSGCVDSRPVWGVLPTRKPMRIASRLASNSNMMPVMATTCWMSSGGFSSGTQGEPTYDGANYYKGVTFSPDQIVECSQNPAQNTSYTEDSGIAVRMNPTTGDFYGALIDYVGPPGEEGGCVGFCQFRILRYNGTTKTVLATVQMVPNIWASDWSSFFSLWVWGQNPVNLMLVIKQANELVLAGSGINDGSSHGTSSGTSGNLPNEAVPFTYQGQNHVWATGNYILTATGGGLQVLNGLGSPYPYGTQGGDGTGWKGWADPQTILPQIITPPDDSTIIPIGDNRWNINGQRSLVVWSGQDSSGQRLLTGQPGIFGQSTSVFGVAHFRARDITDRLTANVISVNQSTGLATIGGYRKSGNIITLS